MAKRAKRRGGAGKSPHRSGKGRRPQHRRGLGAAPDAVLDAIEAALAADEPLPLLDPASTALHFVDQRSDDLLERRGAPRDSIDTLLDNLFAAPLEETSALLTAVATLTGDDELRRRVRREVTLLRASIRYAHAEAGIRDELPVETLAAVDEWEPEYQEAIRTPRLQGPEALLARMGVLDEEAALAAREQPDDDPSSRT